MSDTATPTPVVPFAHVIPILCVEDVPTSYQYYAEVLGFDQVWAWSDQKESFDEGRATFACVRRGSVSIFLCQQGQGNPGAWMSIFIEGVEELEEIYREYVKRGATIVMPPTDEPWGMREMHVQDPDGNTLRIGAGITEEGAE